MLNFTVGPVMSSDEVRKIGGELGSCMYLCVCEHDEFSTPAQPLLKNVKAIRDNM